MGTWRPVKNRERDTAYLGFILDVSIPNNFHTDNAKTKTGEKWTKTSQYNMTKKIHCAPHNKNHNAVERNKQDIKRRTMHTLRVYKDPLIFVIMSHFYC